MERRTALKAISSALGYSLAPATLITLANSCKENKTGEINDYFFFDKEEIVALGKLGEVFLPRTNTPGAIDVSAHLFVDVFYGKIASEEDRTIFKEAFASWKKAFQKVTKTEMTTAEQDAFNENLQFYYGIDKDQIKEVEEVLRSKGTNKETEETYQIYSFLSKFKNVLLLGYFASEEVGENVLNYLPVPGEYEGCVPVESVGNAWSL